MGDLDKDTKRWVKAGHITEAQRAAILSSEAGTTKESPAKSEPAMSLARGGVRAEVFVIGMGGLVALVAAWIAGFDELTGMVVPAAVLALAGVTLLFGVRGGSILADVAFAASLVLFAVAAVEVHELWDVRWLSVIIAFIIAFIGLIRIVRVVVAVPAVALTYVYVVGSFPSANQAFVYLGFPIALVVSASLLYAFRRPIRGWADRVRKWRTGRTDRDDGLAG